MTVLSAESKLYWCGTGLFQETADRLRTIHVPPEGPASTPHGELLRVAGNVYYDVFNNGGANLRIEQFEAIAAWYSMLKRFGDGEQIKRILKQIRRCAKADRYYLSSRYVPDEQAMIDDLETLMNAVVQTVKQWEKPCQA